METESSGSYSFRDCSSFALSLVLPLPIIDEVWDGCLYPIITNSSNGYDQKKKKFGANVRSTETCLVFTLNQIDSDLVEVYEQCVTNNTDVMQCIKTAFKEVIGDETKSQELIDSCVALVFEKVSALYL